MYSERAIASAIKYIFTILLPDYSDEEVAEELAGLDYEAIAQAVRDKARTVYAFEAGGDYEHAFVYCGQELFPQRATKLFETVNRCQADFILTSHSYELWLLEDMTVMAVSNMTVKAACKDASYLAEYRTVKGKLDADCDIGFMPDDLTTELFELCEPQFEGEAPFYEL